MSNDVINKRKRSNSIDLGIIKSSLDEEEKEEGKKNLSKSIIFLKDRQFISFKILQNIDLTTYDYMFIGRKIQNEIIQDFESFKILLKKIKTQFNPKILQNNINFENIKKEGKFSFNNSNLTELILIDNNMANKHIEISINNKYIKTGNSNLNQYFTLYGTKSIFKGKHCFEIGILGLNKINLSIGLVHISDLEFFKISIKAGRDLSTVIKNIPSVIYLYKLTEPILVKKDNIPYQHYIIYGDTFGFCFDLDKKLFYLFLNGEIVNIDFLKINLSDDNDSYVPFISMGNDNEIMFISEELKFEKIYKNYGFVPLDEKGTNNFEISNLKKVTDDYLDILKNYGKLIIQNNNITYSDINQIFYIIFEFLGKYSFQESYIINNSLIKKFIINNNNLIDLNNYEIDYIFLKYILNYSEKRRTIIKNLILNISETLHILLLTGIRETIIPINNLLNILIFLLSKSDIQMILYFSRKTLFRIFNSIFLTFNFYGELFKTLSLDFVMKPINNSQNSINDNKNDNQFFTNLVITKENLEEMVISQQYLNKKLFKEIPNCFFNLLKCIFSQGTDGSIIVLYKVILKYFKGELTDARNDKKFCDLFKNIFIPLMDSFNNEYINIDKKEISIRKYLSKFEVYGEKLGGTINTVFEEYAKNIQNFEKLTVYPIKNFNIVFFLDFFTHFFIKSCNYSFWEFLKEIILDTETFSNSIFSIRDNKNNFQAIHNKIINYIKYHLFYLNLDDLNIFVQFMFNLSDFILNYLFPNKLIYFIPENFITNIKPIIDTIKTISNICNTIKNNLSLKKSQNHDISNFFLEYKNLAENLEKLCKKTSYQYISINIKIIVDENIKKPNNKCICLDNVRKFLDSDDLFTNDDLYSIFNFINLVHNNPEYKSTVMFFIRIFENNMKLEASSYYKLGQRLNVLFSKNIDFLRIITILLYSSLDQRLSLLEEAFSEYRFIPRNSQNQFNENAQNVRNNMSQNIIYSEGNNVIVINNSNSNFNNNQINRNHMELINQALDTGIPIPGRRLVIISEYEGNEIEDREKLSELNIALIGVKPELLKLNNFYRLTSNIKQCYQINTFENKKLVNLLSSLNNLLFSPINISKIEKNVNEQNQNLGNSIKTGYKNLLVYVTEFYSILINNLNEINDQDLFKDISKQRNLLKFKENLQIIEKFNPPDNENDYKLIKDFISKLDQIGAEEALKQNEIKVKNENNEENNLCPICSDTVINSHLIPCNHGICRNCLYQQIFINKHCPFCRIEIKGITEDPNFMI